MIDSVGPRLPRARRRVFGYLQSINNEYLSILMKIFI